MKSDDRQRHHATNGVFLDFICNLPVEIRERLQARHPSDTGEHTIDRAAYIESLFPDEMAEISANLIDEFIDGFRDDVEYRMAMNEGGR